MIEKEQLQNAINERGRVWVNMGFVFPIKLDNYKFYIDYYGDLVEHNGDFSIIYTYDHARELFPNETAARMGAQ